jgi:threonine synthase
LTVTDAELMAGMHRIARTEGMFVSPEAGAAVVAAERLRESGYFSPDDEVVLFATGAGLKHVDLV